MKKFLTVLLALSVVFTYTVGTAFALPNDDSTVAGLNAAKEAVAELEAYPTMADYNATGQAKVKVIIAEYTDFINDAEKIGKVTDQKDAKTVYGYLNTGKKAIDRVATLTQLADAQKAAKEQFEDYVYLIETLEIAKTNSDVFTNSVKDAEVGYKDYESFKDAMFKAFKTAVDVEGVEKALDTALTKADKIYAELKIVEVSQAEIDTLVKAIRTKATGTVTTLKYSQAVVDAYEAAIEEGVAAAKAITTYDEYYKVSDKYLGYRGETAVKAANGGVYIHINQLSVFDVLKNKTLEVEADIKAVEKLLANLGEYDWKDYVDADKFNDEKKWTDIEEFYYQAKYFVENGAFDGTLGAGKAVTALQTMLTTVKATSKTTTVNEAIATAEAKIKELTVVEGYKATLINKIKAYLGKTLKNVAVKNLTEYGDRASYVQSVQVRAANAIGLATTIADADAEYAKFAAQIDDIKTTNEVKFDAATVAYNDAVDNYVAENTAETITADQQILLDKIVADVKAVYAKNQDLKATFAKDDYAKTALQTAVAGDAYSKARVDWYYHFKPTAPATEYYADKYDSVQLIVSNFNKLVNDETAAKIKNWEDFFDAYDDAIKAIDEVKTKDQENYEVSVKAADKAIAELGTPAVTNAFRLALEKATIEYNNYKIAADKFFALDADEQAEVTVALANENKYLDAKHEYNRLVYLDKLNKTEAETTVKEVSDFVKVAAGFLSADIQKYFDKAGKYEIATIIEDTYKAIDAAATNDAKASAALEGIAKLDAVALDNSAAQDVADLIAKVKAEAAKYFNKYEGATFTSDADTKLGLVKDIIAFNAQFSDAAKLAKEELIKDIKGTHMKIGSSAAKGYIRISWKQSNSTVALDGVKVYRSTKKTSGFKLISTFKKQTAKKYTANLKKGTKYYYKVKGYKVIDDVTYYTHESITVGRTFR